MKYRALPVLVGAGVLCLSQSAYAATLTVDDDRADCPAAAYTSVQAAVDAAAPGDTVTICPGSYAEGTGEVGHQRGDDHQEPDDQGRGRRSRDDHAEVLRPRLRAGSWRPRPDLRNGVGDIVAVVGTPSQPLKVDISGVTVDGWDPQGRPVAVEAGILFLDAQGLGRPQPRDERRHLRGRRRLHAAPAATAATQPGIGIAQTTNALYAPVDGARQLRIDRTRVEKYNKIGVLIDGAEQRLGAVLAVRHGRLGRHHRQPDHRPHAVHQLPGHRQLLADAPARRAARC